MVWGESNSRDFLDWADFCRNNALKERGISTTGGPNFVNDKSSLQYKAAKTTILDIIQKNRTISIQQLYNILPTDIVANPTSKHIILQLYFEDNLQIQGQLKNNDSRESNFVVVFVKKQQPVEPPIQRTQNIQKQQSNIEDLIDNNWRATGRKLEFDKKEKIEKENLNISLKRTNPTTTNKLAEKPNIDVRDLNKKELPKETIIKAMPKPENDIPVIKNENIKYIQIKKPEPEMIIEQPTVKLNLQFNPNTPPVKEEIILEDKVFYGLSAFDLYYIEAFLSDSLHIEKQLTQKIKITKQIVKTRADIKYLEEKDDPNIIVNCLIIISCLIIIGIFIAIAKSKNKIRAKAFKIYNSDLKSKGYGELKNELKSKHPKIIEF